MIEMEEEQEKISLGIGERLKTFSPDFTASTGKMVEHYLANNLPELIQRYDLALKSDLTDVESSTRNLESRVEDLESWKGNTEKRIDDTKRSVDLLEKKYTVKG
jgi:hypothetical protein